MATQKRTRTVSNQSNETFHYKFGSVAALLIILGFLFNNGGLFLIGFIVALIWAYRYQKVNRKFHWLWIIIVMLLLIPVIVIAMKDAAKFM